jgi:tRNA1Val (adenine37-N6)-methyltransferase
MSAPFRFKKFTIQQDKSAMKVGTDSVLLGAWISPIEGNLLDIGCGTGLLALMLAQRIEHADIDAIDIDENAYLQASENIILSDWSNKISVFKTALQKFKTAKKYQLIFTNPPYFVESFKAPEKARSTARHTDDLPFEVLIDSVLNLLDKFGIFALILPVVEANLFINLATQKGLFLNRKCEVKPTINKPVKRVMMEFSLVETELKEEQITIETDKRHQYTKEYISLTQDFYLYDR